MSTCILCPLHRTLSIEATRSRSVDRKFAKIKLVSNDDFAFPKNRQVETWPIHNQRYEQQPYASGSTTADLKRFILNKGPMDGYGFCFQFDHHSGTPCVTLPAFLHSGGEVKKKSITLDFTDYYFFQKTMTFHGSVNLHPPLSLRKEGCKYSAMTCVLQFSRDGQFVRHGQIRWFAANSDTPGFNPLDGKWSLLHFSGDEFASSVRQNMIYVQNHTFYYEVDCIKIDIDPETHCPKFKLPREEELGLTSSFALPPGSTGPKEGEQMEWTSMHSPTNLKLEWERLSLCEFDNVSLKPNVKFVYRQVNRAASASSLPSYHANQLWGNVFCPDIWQNAFCSVCIGMASYHFVSSKNAYVSYEHPLSALWPTLDDGSPVPSRVNFKNTTWDEEARTFRGDICWLEEYETTWHGHAKWSFEMIFDENFMYISGGTRSGDDGEQRLLDLDCFGHDLVYANAKVEDPLRDYLKDGEIDGDVVFSEAPGPTKEALENLVTCLVSGLATVFDFGEPQEDLLTRC